jgi:hypothetical protein
MRKKPLAQQVVVVTGALLGCEEAPLGQKLSPRAGDPGARGRFSDLARKSTAWTSGRLLRWLS